MSSVPRWREQCEAARGIRAEFGAEKALGYLLGEKFLHLLWAADRQPALAAELPAFAEAAREIFTPEELRGYFTGPRRVGAVGHVLDDDAYERFQSSEALGEADVEQAAQDAILFERMRRIVLAG